VRLPENLCGHHAITSNVVTERLDLQPPIVEAGAKPDTLVHVVSVDVKAAVPEDVTEAKVVGSHRWMRTPREGIGKSGPERTSNASLGAQVIEQDVRQASRVCGRSPTI
jgi:hypothetical protein